MHGDSSGIFITRQTIIRYCGRQKHKSHIMMQSEIALKAFLHFLFGNPCDLRIFFILGILIQQPHNATPESVGPPV